MRGSEIIKMNNNLYHSFANEGKNVGDITGPYLYKKISGNDFHYVHPRNTKEGVFVTVGSILDNAIGGATNSIIWGSGMISDALGACRCEKIYAVRGHKTRERVLSLRGECSVVLGDPAILVPKFYNPVVEKKHTLGIILHFIHSRELVKEMTKRLEKSNISYKFIDVAWGVERFVDSLLGCEYTISSSLHGLIFSHAYGIRSMPFFFENLFLDGKFFKFEDYYSVYPECNFEVIMYRDLLKCGNIIEKVERYKNPTFPLNTKALHDVCPFRKE